MPNTPEQPENNKGRVTSEWLIWKGGALGWCGSWGSSAQTVRIGLSQFESIILSRATCFSAALRALLAIQCSGPASRSELPFILQWDAANLEKTQGLGNLRSSISQITDHSDMWKVGEMLHKPIPPSSIKRENNASSLSTGNDAVHCEHTSVNCSSSVTGPLFPHSWLPCRALDQHCLVICVQHKQMCVGPIRTNQSAKHYKSLGHMKLNADYALASNI